MSNRLSRLGRGANNIMGKKVPSNVFVKQDKTQVDDVNASKTQVDKSRVYFAVRMTQKEALYMDKMKERNQITGASVFHLVMAEYMRAHPM